jgi:DNA polymerase III gamma/tau subunit
MTDADYRERLIDSRLAAVIEQLPAVSVTGPRPTGKTTTARRHAASLVRLELGKASGFVRA